MGIKMTTKTIISAEIIQLFQKRNYEKHVLYLMNASKVIFPGKYRVIEKQSNGEGDFIEVSTGNVFDAKLPFTTEQVELLTSGSKHRPLVTEWLSELMKEASEFDVFALRNGTYDVTRTKLYCIMQNKIEREMKNNYSIVFFMPFVIGHSIGGMLSECSDFLDVIYDGLLKNNCLSSNKRELYVISPTGNLRDEFILRNLNERKREVVLYQDLGEYFSYELHNVVIE